MLCALIGRALYVLYVEWAHSKQHVEFLTAAARGDLRVCKKCVQKKKIDVNCEDENNATPLMHAVYNGNIELVEFLLVQGADVASKVRTKLVFGMRNISPSGKRESASCSPGECSVRGWLRMLAIVRTSTNAHRCLSQLKLTTWR